MLSVGASAVRSASRVRLSRTFATVVDTAGYKVAAVDNGQPTSAVTVLVRAGSRYEPKPGVAHALKNFAFKGTEKRSALGTVRESEIYGGVLSSSLSREHLALTAEFLRGDESFYVDVLTSILASTKFTRHEFLEYVLPVVADESSAATSNPATRALELAHTIAFRTGLGSPLFANPHSSITSEDVKSFAHSVFTKDNIVILGTGIGQETLSKLVQKSLGSVPTRTTSTTSGSPLSAYFGGETRVESHEGPQTVFIGFGKTGAPTPELSVLSAHLSPQPSIKWSLGLSPISAAIPAGASVQMVLLPYSDAALFGLLVQGPTASAVKEAAKAALQALKSSAPSAGLKADELKKAVAKAKFSAASAVDDRDGLVSVMGSKVLAGSETSLDTILASFDKVTAASVSKSTSALLKGKPTYVAVGDVLALPYVDELGL